MSLDNSRPPQTEETHTPSQKPRRQNDGAPSGAPHQLLQQHSNPMSPWYYAFSQVTGAYLPYTYYWIQMQQLHSGRGTVPPEPPATDQRRPAPPQAGAQVHPQQHTRPPVGSSPKKPSGDTVGGIVSSEDEGNDDDTSGKSNEAGNDIANQVSIDHSIEATSESDESKANEVISAEESCKSE